MTIEENWKPVEGFEGIYSVSDTGNVYSHKMNKVMKTYLNNNGYECIKLQGKGKRHSFLIHRLVAMAFCEGYSDGLVVNHKDAVRTHNNASNLEWLTQMENNHDTMRRGKHTHTEAHKAARIARRIPVNCLDRDSGEVIETFPSLEHAKHWLGISHASYLSCAINGKAPAAYGYKWERVTQN